MPEVRNIQEASVRLKAVAEHTPLVKNLNLSEEYGATVMLKREDLQLVRSYKIRGAYNKISSPTPLTSLRMAWSVQVRAIMPRAWPTAAANSASKARSSCPVLPRLKKSGRLKCSVKTWSISFLKATLMMMPIKWPSNFAMIINHLLFIPLTMNWSSKQCQHVIRIKMKNFFLLRFEIFHETHYTFVIIFRRIYSI